MSDGFINLCINKMEIFITNQVNSSIMSQVVIIQLTILMTVVSTSLFCFLQFGQFSFPFTTLCKYFHFEPNVSCHFETVN